MPTCANSRARQWLEKIDEWNSKRLLQLGRPGTKIQHTWDEVNKLYIYHANKAYNIKLILSQRHLSSHEEGIAAFQNSLSLDGSPILPGQFMKIFTEIFSINP